MSQPNPKGFTPRRKVQYPQDNDQLIRQWASYPLIGDQEAIKTLDTIRNLVFGNADEVDKLAYFWSQCQVMNDTYTSIQQANNSLSGNWQGPAKQQYDTFASGVQGVAKGNQSAMGSMGNTLGNCVAQVYQTYGNCISAMASCAGTITKITVEAGLSFIPVVGQILDADAIHSLIDVLGNFVSSVDSLIGQSVAQIGSYKQNGVLFQTASSAFLAPAAPGQRIGDPGSWQQE